MKLVSLAFLHEGYTFIKLGSNGFTGLQATVTTLGQIQEQAPHKQVEPLLK